MSTCLFDSRVPSDTRAKADLGVGPRGPCYFGQEKNCRRKKAGWASKKPLPSTPSSWSGSATARTRVKNVQPSFQYQKCEKLSLSALSPLAVDFPLCE